MTQCNHSRDRFLRDVCELAQTEGIVVRARCCALDDVVDGHPYYIGKKAQITKASPNHNRHRVTRGVSPYRASVVSAGPLSPIFSCDPLLGGLARALKGVGRVYQETFIDTYAKVACAKLYDRNFARTVPCPVEDGSDRTIGARADLDGARSAP